MSGLQNVDLLINARWIIPVIPEDKVFKDCSLAISDGLIVAIVPSAEARKRYSPRDEINLLDHALIPGLINTHGHAAMSLMRGFADDKPLMDWLENHIWPTEAKWVSEEFVFDGTQLAMAEMLRSGTTCFSDMYFFPDQAAKAAQLAGMRAQICAPILDFPSAWAQDADEYINKSLSVHDDFRSSDLINVGFGPHAPYTVSDEPLKRIAMLADEMQAPVQIHLHETAFEVENAIQQQGVRPIERLQKLNLLTPLVQCIHMTQLIDADIEILKTTGAHVVHCPESNLKLASGFCPIGKLFDAGINVALGTDSAASNNDLDLFSEMKTAALLAKAVSSDATALDAHQALRMATINGAKAIGQETTIGSLEPGKAADICAVQLNDIESSPIYNPVSHLVYTNIGHKVSDVWVNGKRLLNKRQLTTLNREEILQKTQHWQAQLSTKKN
ncbi:TRZ/ATZ family hydrolase [Aurantivibrio infirmus]